MRTPWPPTLSGAFAGIAALIQWGCNVVRCIHALPFAATFGGNFFDRQGLR
jgi:hypothetical protein